MKIAYILLTVIFLVSCKQETKELITHVDDYEPFLQQEKNNTYRDALSKEQFWSKRLQVDSSGVGDIGPLAQAKSTLFKSTGNAQYLLDAETLLRKAVVISAHNKDTYVRSLSHNLISQHRFKEAKMLLEESYEAISNKRATELMLFDVHMELGDYEKADVFLGKIKNNKDYNYLIRLAKWSDYQGNLEAAINYLEQAKEIAESRNTKGLKVWTYSNLADFYGHAGRIKDGYEHYLKTLEIEPDNAYAKKGIAWIVYSYERDSKEAIRILDRVIKDHQVPDYLLLKSEMAEFEGNSIDSEQLKKLFISSVKKGNYGEMYNTYLIELLVETDPVKAYEIALKEVENRATPETYHLLALTQLRNGKEKEALQTIELYVKDKTSEPMALYHSAMVYKANGMTQEVKEIREELNDAAFELGPVLFQKIKNL